MLVLHSDSRCDVCLCEFVADMSSKSPHAIACGHIFCRDCLYSTTPPLCPLCRKTYLPNKMKKLHVDRPEEVDDHKEVDLLQRLVLSWDTPLEQLQQVVGEVDAWLATRDEDSCISLRKARTTLDRYKTLKASDVESRNTIPHLEDEIHRLEQENYLAREEAAMQIQIHEETHRTQLRELTKELAVWKTRSKKEPRPNPAPGYGSYGATRNPLPHPPEPIPTDQVPTTEQFLSQSGVSLRYSELPADSPRNWYDGGESRRSRHWLTEERHPSYTSHTSASSSNHYVQPHVSPSYEYQSPSNLPATDPHRPLQVQFHSGRPLDIFGFTSELVHEYGVGFAQGRRSALSRSRHDTVIGPPFYADPIPSRTTVQPSTAHIEEVESPNVYPSQPQPAPSGTSSRHRNRRHSTLRSSIASSSPSRGHGAEERLPSRSRSRSSSRGPTPSASSHSRSARSQPPEVASAYVSPPEAVTTHNPPQPNGGRSSSPSIRSSRTTHSTSTWGTQCTNLTGGDLDIPMRIPRDLFAGYASSSRTRNSSLSDISISGLDLNAEATRAASPARAIDNMTGVLPSSDNPDMSSSSLSEAETVRVQSRNNRGGHRAVTTALDQRDYHEDAYRGGFSSTARPAEHDDRQYEYSRGDRVSSSHRSAAAVDPRIYRTDYSEAPPPPHRRSDHSSYGHLGRSGQPLRPSDTLPVESPGFPVSVEYTTEEDADYYRRHDISSAETTSFTGNALGLELNSAGEISAPAPIVPTNSMMSMRSWNDPNRN